MAVAAAVFLAIPLTVIALLYGGTRPKGTSVSDRASQGCGVALAIPAVFLVLLLLVLAYAELNRLTGGDG